MNILMMTNTYKPILGGLEKSIENFSKQFRDCGHRVLIVAPDYPDMQPEEGVVRIPAIQNFNGSDFSVQLPIPGALVQALGDFKPDLVHAHHPFFIGDTALRVASKFNVPLVFTHHTLYEENVHYVPGNEEAMKRFVIELSTGYANLADMVFAPSESVMNLMKERGVTTPIEVVPTGIDVDKYRRGSGKIIRKRLDIPEDAFVVGHLGRLAPEKNLEFLARAVAQFLKKEPKAHFMVAGKGPSEESIKEIFSTEGVSDRLHLAGVVTGKDLINTYHAMDVFAFASQSETQGLVLTEAAASSVPLVGVDAPGVREVIKDTVNGRLLAKQNTEEFVEALVWMKSRNASQIRKIQKACRDTAEEFSMLKSTDKALKIYLTLVVQGFSRRDATESQWDKTSRMIQAQWDLIKNLTKAAGALIMPQPSLSIPSTADVELTTVSP